MNWVSGLEPGIESCVVATTDEYDGKPLAGSDSRYSHETLWPASTVVMISWPGRGVAPLAASFADIASSSIAAPALTRTAAALEGICRQSQ